MSAFILTTCERCRRGFTPELWMALRLLGHTKSSSRLLEVRVCCCGVVLEAPVCDALIFGARLDIVPTEELPQLAEIAAGVIACTPPDRLGTPAIEYARLLERLYRAELERRLGEESRRVAH